MTQAGFRFSVYGLMFLGMLGMTHAEAASLYFDPGSVELSRGDTVTMALRLDTDEEECVNAIDAVVHYDAALRAVDVSRGQSILNIWVEDPVIDETAHTISFAGGIPGGYCGRIPGDPSLTNVLLEIIFRSPGFSVGSSNASEARIWIDEASEAYLNDGLGTNAALLLQNASVTLLPTPGNTLVDEWRGEVSADQELPSDFVITLSKDETAFSARYFIVFNTSDKQSGIDHYEVMEEPFSEWGAFKWGRADAPWVTAESPYVLTDQTLNSTIRVKAIDKAGNARIATFVPDVALRSISKDRILTLLVIGGFTLLLFVLIAYALWKRKQRIEEEDNLVT